MITSLQNSKKVGLLISGLLIFHLVSYAQSVGYPLVHNYDKYAYQGGNQNWSVAVGNKGLVYFGNNEGLLEFDGSNWKFNVFSGRTAIRSVAFGPDERIYVGGYEEFGYYTKDENGALSYLSLSSKIEEDQIHNDEIWRIIPVNNRVYFQSFSSIFMYDGETIESLEIPGSLVLLLLTEDRLFIHVVGAGLHEMIENTLVPVPGANLLADDEIKVVLPFGKNRLLVGAAKKGLFIYNGKSFEPWTIPEAENIRQAEINNGIFINGKYLIGTIANGLFYLNEEGKLLYHLHAGNVLQNNTVLSMAPDSSGNLWLGLDRGVDYVIRQDVFSFYLDPSGELGTVFDAAYFEGYLWLGTNHGLFKLQSNDLVKINNPEMIEESRGQVWDLAVVDDELLVGHTNGTYKVKDSKMEEISIINGGFDIQLYETDKDGVLIQSTYSNLAVYRKGPNGWTFSNSLSGIIEPLSQIEIDPYGQIWAAHLHRNIFKITLNENLDSVVRMVTIGTEKGFPFDRNLHLSKIENRIVFPTGQSIYTYDDLKDTIIPYTWLNKNLGNFITSTHIIPASKGNYWFINGQEIGYFRIRGSDITKLFSYNLSMQRIHLGTSFPKIVNLDKSRSLICLDGGFTIYDAALQRDTGFAEKIYLREVRISNGTMVEPLPLSVPPGAKSIPFNFRNIHFSYSGEPHYYYPQYRLMMAGLDDAWSEWTTDSYADFVRIPPGDYTFRVQSRNIQGEPGPITEYPFIINPPWYFSIISIIVYGLIVVAIIIIIRFLFIRRLMIHARKIEFEEQEKIRVEQLQNQQKYMKLKNQLLQTEIEAKNNQLADFTMNVIRKNEVLMKIKEEIEIQKEELGDRFPNYNYEKLLKILDSSITSEDEWKVFEYHFDLTHENFFKRLKQNYQELTPGDLKLCAYLRMNLTSKELAPLLNIGIKSVEVHRSRLRKKLKLTSQDNLIEFLLKF